MKRLFTKDLDLEKFKKDKFNILRTFPETHSVVVHVTENDIQITPASAGGRKKNKLFQFEKAALYKMLVGIDNLRLLGKDISLYLCLTPCENFLYYMTVDRKNVLRKTRKLFCEQFDFKDAIIQYGITGQELLDSYMVLPDVPLAAKHPGEDELLMFNLEDLYDALHKERYDDKYNLDEMLFGGVVGDFMDFLERL